MSNAHPSVEQQTAGFGLMVQTDGLASHKLIRMAMAGLRASAEAEVEALKRQTHQELAEHARGVREQVGLAATSTAHRHQSLIAEATASAARA